MKKTYLRCARIALDAMREAAMKWRQLRDKRWLAIASGQRRQANYWLQKAAAIRR